MTTLQISPPSRDQHLAEKLFEETDIGFYDLKYEKRGVLDYLLYSLILKTIDLRPCFSRREQVVEGIKLLKYLIRHSGECRTNLTGSNLVAQSAPEGRATGM